MILKSFYRKQMQKTLMICSVYVFSYLTLKKSPQATGGILVLPFQLQVFLFGVFGIEAHKRLS